MCTRLNGYEHSRVYLNLRRIPKNENACFRSASTRENLPDTSFKLTMTYLPPVIKNCS